MPTNADPHAIDRYDAEEQWRCPMLGGPVHFGYCRTMNEGVPCARVLGCWLQRLPLVEFLKANYSPEELQRALSAKTKGRLERMIEAVEHAPEPADASGDEPGPAGPR
jgi:hypothetical protein